MGIFKLIMHATVTWLIVCKTAKGSGIDCTVDCACCIDRKCGAGHFFQNECKLGCIDGYSGARCYEKCIHNCTKCDNFEDTENCTACYDGYYLGPARDCTSQCLPGCKTCTSGTTCTSCKEGYYNDNGHKDCRYRYCSESCNCENNQCVSCKDGYYDTSINCYSLCPGNCVNCSAYTDCGSCKDGYFKGYKNNNISFPLLNDCTYKCQDNCIRCSSYDSCSVCKSGLYGSYCKKNCSAGCINTCHILTGNCDCFPNFAGERCDRCKAGKYGNMCNQQCSAGCKADVCDKDSGDCTDGCVIDIITGDKCDVCSAALEQSNQLPTKTFAALGTILVLSIIGNIVLLVILVRLIRRIRVFDNDNTTEQHYENTGIKLEIGHSVNVINTSSQAIASDRDSFGKADDYEPVTVGSIRDS
ncbi:multiple epidermal growth factor-like domains protein 10 [Ruditapes philippinarum]|uniref:multiple epidermal growth factor-like domains protein 10 n=1 Tax=Ruditapes philippinarum TaxID=129788 RepID=UPI00295A5F10|nr:multiple epidermal growth factor-like domains protein 10 [Ruditapes philippinarum]